MKPLAEVPHHRMQVIYLNDHIAAAVAWSALAARIARENAGTPLGDTVERLRRDLEEEVPLLRVLLRETGGRERRAKQWLARSAERIGRFKSNGAVRGYSPLSRLVEIEALTASLALRASMWRSLSTALGGQRTVGRTTLAELDARAHRQIGELDDPLRHVASALQAA
jgi:hypothetical protein